MPRHIAFLRGMNLGNRRITNEELAGHFVDAGFRGVATYQASGNVIFDDPGEPVADVEAAIEDHLADALGYEVDTYVRRLDALRSLLELDGIEAAEAAGFKPHVIFLKTPTDAGAEAALAALEGPDDRFRPLGTEVVWLRRGGLQDAEIGQPELEDALGPKQTMRTLGTVRRILKKFGEGATPDS